MDEAALKKFISEKIHEEFEKMKNIENGFVEINIKKIAEILSSTPTVQESTFH